MSIVRKTKSQKGAVLPIVVVASCVFVLLGMSLLQMAQSEMVLTHKTIKETQAFHLAEAGVARFVADAYDGTTADIDLTSLGDGSYQVDTYLDASPAYAISTGTVGTYQKKIRVEVSFLSQPFEHAVYSCNSSGEDWTLELNGFGSDEQDIINGDIYVDGDVAMYGDSNVNSAPDPNPHGLAGDVIATGEIDLYDDASISGESQTGAEEKDAPDLTAMEYETNNTHDVSRIFSDEGVSSGRLPSDHELYDVLTKNPSDRSSECFSTSGDDYFLEPAVITGGWGGETSATTPLNLGNDRVYYIDGNVWIHSKSTYGFLLEGNATIVATGNIYICDNTAYANDQALLGMVALGEYDAGGQLTDGGNIYFGDPRYGTMYTVSALMFAGNDFLYNTDSVTGESAEPETGFTVYGNFSALNQISIQRDWYDPSEGGDPKSAYFDPTGSGVSDDEDDGDDDGNNGHGNDEDGYDESNPGNSSGTGSGNDDDDDDDGDSWRDRLRDRLRNRLRNRFRDRRRGDDDEDSDDEDGDRGRGRDDDDDEDGDDDDDEDEGGDDGDSETGQWRDLEDGSVLSSSEVRSLRHYQMIVNYDARVRDVGTQPPGLPQGVGTIFNGVTRWEELTADEEN